MSAEDGAVKRSVAASCAVGLQLSQTVSLADMDPDRARPWDDEVIPKLPYTCLGAYGRYEKYCPDDEFMPYPGNGYPEYRGWVHAYWFAAVRKDHTNCGCLRGEPVRFIAQHWQPRMGWFPAPSCWTKVLQYELNMLLGPNWRVSNAQLCYWRRHPRPFAPGDPQLNVPPSNRSRAHG